MSLALAAKNGLFGTCSKPSNGIAIVPICVMWPAKVAPHLLAQPLARDRRRRRPPAP